MANYLRQNLFRTIFAHHRRQGASRSVCIFTLATDMCVRAWHNQAPMREQRRQALIDAEGYAAAALLAYQTAGYHAARAELGAMPAPATRPREPPPPAARPSGDAGIDAADIPVPDTDHNDSLSNGGNSFHPDHSQTSTAVPNHCSKPVLSRPQPFQLFWKHYRARVLALATISMH